MDSKGSFELHTWMIARFIETSGLDIIPLSRYVIATCYERMITRMTYHVSKSFRDALKNLPPTFELPKLFPLIGSTSNDSRFITHLLKVKSRLKLNTPIANLVKHKNDLYNEETYADFHSILSELLELLLRSLDELKVMHHKFGGNALSPKQLNDTQAKIDFIGIIGTLLRLLVKGRAIKKCLHSVVGFLPDRAAGLSAKADDRTDDDELREMSDGEDDEVDDEVDDEADGEVDDEADGDLVPGHDSGAIKIQLDPKSQACMKSLNLVVVYFDALLVLSRFVKNENSRSVNVKINIKVLLLPCPSKDTRMLPWRMLLEHETYFPGKPSPSAKQIIEFLEPLESSTKATDDQESSQQSQKASKKSQKASKKSQKASKKMSDNQKSSGKKSQKKPTEVCPESIAGNLASLQRDTNADIKTFTDQITQAIDSLKTLHYGDATPGSIPYIDKIIKRLQSIKNSLAIYPSSMSDMYEEVNSVIGMLRTLGDNARLERMILRAGSSLDTGVGFKGTVHAEACIASYCTFTDPGWFPPVSHHFIMCCSDLSDVVCSLPQFEQQVYLNSAVQYVGLRSVTSTPHSFSETHTTPSNHVHCLAIFRWRLLQL
jgi:hypothetical protein